ncbi:MAG: glutathione S-transferase family protein [Burkholderiales bacterium]|nr:glutathione S-transferase family protein [Burkholderiales bacterium]
MPTPDPRAFVLFHGWRSSASRRVRLVLAEKGLAYESRLVDMLRGDQHSPEYLAMNPNGVVPTLLHGDRVLYESSVVAEYLDELYPEPPLMPADAYQRALLRNFVRWIDEACLPKLIVFNWSQSMQPSASQWSEAQLAERLARVPSAQRREAWTRVARKPYTDEEKAEAMQGLLQLPQRMEAMLGASLQGWLFGAGFSIGDIAATPFIMRISELKPGAIEALPRVADWWQRVRARPSFTAARIEPYAGSRAAEASAGG